MLYEIKRIYQNDPSAKMGDFLLYPWLYAVLFHKYLAHPLYNIKLYFIARCISQFLRFFTGIEIHPWAKIGRWLFIDHGMWVVIGETAQIGDDCIIFHWVTLWWTWKHIWKRHPTVGNNVLIWAQATILWPLVIGNNAQVWAASVIINADIPENATVVWNPWRIVKLQGEKVDKKLIKI